MTPTNRLPDRPAFPNLAAEDGWMGCEHPGLTVRQLAELVLTATIASASPVETVSGKAWIATAVDCGQAVAGELLARWEAAEAKAHEAARKPGPNGQANGQPSARQSLLKESAAWPAGPPRKVYRGSRSAPFACRVTVTLADGRTLPLPPRDDLVDYGPRGFSWGFPDEGACKLSLAILADAMGDARLAEAWHVDFARDRVQALEGDAWELTSGDVVDYVTRTTLAELLMLGVDWRREAPAATPAEHFASAREVLRRHRASAAAPAGAARACRACGCTDDDCRRCVERTGKPCHWVEADLCSACAPTPSREGGGA